MSLSRTIGLTLAGASIFVSCGAGIIGGDNRRGINQGNQIVGSLSYGFCSQS
jgi:hypothetical protein